MLIRDLTNIKKGIQSIFNNVGGPTDFIEIGILTGTLDTGIYKEFQKKQYTKHGITCAISFNPKEEELSDIAKSDRASIFIFKVTAQDLDSLGLLNSTKINTSITTDAVIFYNGSVYDIIFIEPKSIINGVPHIFNFEAKKDTRK